MPKAKTTTTTSSKAAKTATKVAAPAKVVAKKAAAPKKVAAKKPEVVAATPAAVVAAPVEDEVPTLTGDFTEFMAKLQQVSSLLSSLKSEFRTLEKKATRELKAAQKASAKRKRKAGNRSPSGFVKPTLISNELAAFLGKEVGTQMARTEVTREINAYIRANKLQDPQNGRKINADTKLTSLLKLSPGDELTYFNLQKFMSPHFAKASKPVVDAAVASA
jgi:chromatin remodeling complex protein RSC6|tara:strand:+ start:749 stop:1405 length:657 start_codon:yes stop_codon:yes gene_type:complete